MNNFPRMHVSLYVSDLDKSIKFYNQLFNQAPEKIKDKYAKYILKSPSLIISFIENKERVQSNFGHLGIQVETQEELQEKLALAKNQGIVSLEEVGTACCYAVQDKFWASDPDGIQWEIYYFHEDVEFNDPKYADGMTAACCLPEEKAPIEKKKLKLVNLNTDGETCSPDSGCC